MATRQHLPFDPPLYMCVYCKDNPLPASGAWPPEVRSTAANTQADATRPNIGVRAVRTVRSHLGRIANRSEVPDKGGGLGSTKEGDTSLPFHNPHTTRHGRQHTCVSYEARQANSHFSLGEAC